MPGPSDQFDRWHRNVARGSQLYADVSRRRVEAFCRQMATPPEKLVGLSGARLRRLVEDYLDEERKKERSGDYVRTTTKALRSWLSYNGKEFPKGLKLPNERSHPRVEREDPITPEQLRKTVLAANPGQRVVISLMAFSGLRPQVLGSYDGKDGLRVGDIEGVKIQGRSVEFEKVPALVKVRSTSSKAGHAYFTFLGSEGCEYLRQHLEERLIGGEAIDKETDLVSPSKSGKQFMTTINVGDRARQALRAAGVEARPYALRAYFFSRCLEAANAGKVSDRYVEFWSGHTGDVTARHYTTGRPNLPESMVEDQRAAYKRCEPFLSSVPIRSTEERDLQTRRVVLRMHGYTEEEVAKMDIASKTDDELIALADAKRLENQRAVSAAQSRPGQKAVPIAEVGRMLEAGWEYVAPLGPDRAVLRGPSPPLFAA